MNETLKFGHQKLNITGVASRRDAEYDPDGRQQSRDTELHREDRRMDLQRAIPLICGTLFVSLLLNSLLAVDDSISEKADQNEQSIAKVLSSDKAVVKNIVYGLEVDDNRLYLTSQPLEGADRQLKRDELKFAIPKDRKVVELSLAKLDGKNLVAVVKIALGGEYDFHCLTFIGPWGGGHVRDRHKFFEAKFYSTQDDLKILAIGGKHFAGSPFIVLGDIGDIDLDDDALSIVTEGVFYFSQCPWPPSDGALSQFRVRSGAPQGTTQRSSKVSD